MDSARTIENRRGHDGAVLGERDRSRWNVRQLPFSELQRLRSRCKDETLETRYWHC